MLHLIETTRFHLNGELTEHDLWLKQKFERVYGLNPLQPTQEKEKSSVDQGFTGCVNIFLLECRYVENLT